MHALKLGVPGLQQQDRLSVQPGRRRQRCGHVITLASGAVCIDVRRGGDATRAQCAGAASMRVTYKYNPSVSRIPEPRRRFVGRHGVVIVIGTVVVAVVQEDIDCEMN
ncbi:hypothetical protein HK405_012525, partial [Cladochytrium tenue]